MDASLRAIYEFTEENYIAAVEKYEDPQVFKNVNQEISFYE